MTNGKKIALGVSASIAIHRALDLVSELRKLGHEVSVLMSPDAKRLISPQTFQAISLSRVYHEMWEASADMDHDHIRIAQTADLFCLAPATANTLCKLAHGIVDNVLLTTAFAFEGPRVYAPAMNTRMWRRPAVAKACQLLDADGWQRVGPVSGDLACGEEGEGRLAPVSSLLDAVAHALAP
ncbi:MAG: phosphopantothenoylcysteine decarboxylase [Planctomycetes bacterium]|nr:phosphopantothenoylcysteine decarboxylase [Planctomycetota bacterium]